MPEPGKMRRLGFSLNDEEEDSLLRQITDMESTRPRFPLNLPPSVIISSDVLILGNPSEDANYLDWCNGFVEGFKGEKGEKHRKGLDALRVLAAARVSLGYTVRRIYEYVLLDLQFDQSLVKVETFRSSRSGWERQLRKATNSIERLKERMEKKGDPATGDPFPQFSSIAQTKAEVMTVMFAAIAELERLYEFEMASSRLQGIKFVHSTWHNSRLNYLLPPECYPRRRRFWGEIVSLMDAAAAVIIEKRWSTAAARFYDLDQVRVAAGRASERHQLQIAKLLLKIMPDFLDKVKAGSLDTAIAELPKANYRSSVNTELISELARKLRVNP